MGGKALQRFGIETVRCSTKDHERISMELKPRIERLFNTDVRFVRYFRNKESHGDLDVLIRNSGQLGNVKEKIQKEFETDKIHNNGGVISFAYQNYQIDIIPQKESVWEFAPYFFDWDPVGNLTGKVAHKFGLKFGFSGLVFPFRNFSGRLSVDIPVSKNPRKVFQFLGFDFDRYLKGFDTKEEIFKFVASSTFFDPDGFLFENLNHIDKKRNKKRKTYNEFLEWTNKTKPNPGIKLSKDKESHIPFIEIAFPESNLSNKFEELKVRDNQLKEMVEKFNGRLIMKVIPNLKGKELGDSIRRFKESFDDFEHFVNDHSSGDIIAKFVKIYNEK